MYQDVYLWNRFSKANSEIAFKPSRYFSNPSPHQKNGEAMSEDAFKKIFSQSPVKTTNEV